MRCRSSASDDSLRVAITLVARYVKRSSSCCDSSTPVGDTYGNNTEQHAAAAGDSMSTGGPDEAQECSGDS